MMNKAIYAWLILQEDCIEVLSLRLQESAIIVLARLQAGHFQ